MFLQGPAQTVPCLHCTARGTTAALQQGSMEHCNHGQAEQIQSQARGAGSGNLKLFLTLQGEGSEPSSVHIRPLNVTLASAASTRWARTEAQCPQTEA